MPAIRNIAISFLLVLQGCVNIPEHCKTPEEKRADTRPELRELLKKEFDSQRVPTRGGALTVFTPKRIPKNENGAAVLVLHEMPALTPDVLKMAIRLSNQGYSVHVPLLWGTSDENAASRTLFLRRALELRASPRWRAAAAEVDRPIVDQLASLCEVILAGNAKKRMGVIGNCLTGILPFALAARVPEVVAPVASQPTLPLTFSQKANDKTGLSKAETQKLQGRIKDEPTFQLLAFRFEEDYASPAQRFITLGQEFGGRFRFLDGTIPVELYHGRDRLPKHVHSVLTNCFPKNEKFATFHAWEECLRFLETKLVSEEPGRYHFRPYE